MIMIGIDHVIFAHSSTYFFLFHSTYWLAICHMAGDHALYSAVKMSPDHLLPSAKYLFNDLLLGWLISESMWVQASTVGIFFVFSQ